MTDEIVSAPLPTIKSFNNLFDLSPLGRLTVIAYLGKSRWRCNCLCGNSFENSTSGLVRMKYPSCGCHQKEIQSAKQKSHGGSGTRLYYVWNAMKSRCHRPATEYYDIYGGRGIIVCPEWHNFAPFQDWALANGYQQGLEIDRKESNGNYEPDNCRWVTTAVNQLNKRSARGSTSQYVGVFREKRKNLQKVWTAFTTIEGKRINLGRFATELEAAIARDAYCERVIPGQFHRNIPITNQPLQPQPPVPQTPSISQPEPQHGFQTNASTAVQELHQSVEP